MLIETPYKIGDTVSLKLSSGEEIVGRLDAEDETYYTLRKPMVLIAQPEGLGLAPYMYSVSPDSKFMLRTNSVSCLSKTQEEISKQYTKTTTGIVT
jgi:small nuclear ribonucleoprotein (snRNP)-like protein